MLTRVGDMVNFDVGLALLLLMEGDVGNLAVGFKVFTRVGVMVNLDEGLELLIRVGDFVNFGDGFEETEDFEVGLEELSRAGDNVNEKEGLEGLSRKGESENVINDAVGFDVEISVDKDDGAEGIGATLGLAGISFTTVAAFNVCISMAALIKICLIALYALSLFDSLLCAFR